MLVVSDRTVLDAQLQEAIFDFERTHGVVESITSKHGSKSTQLSQVLKDVMSARLLLNRIIICFCQLQAAIAPVADRLLKHYKAAQQEKAAARRPGMMKPLLKLPRILLRLWFYLRAIWEPLFGYMPSCHRYSIMVIQISKSASG